VRGKGGGFVFFYMEPFDRPTTNIFGIRGRGGGGGALPQHKNLDMLPSPK